NESPFAAVRLRQRVTKGWWGGGAVAGERGTPEGLQDRLRPVMLAHAVENQLAGRRDGGEGGAWARPAPPPCDGPTPVRTRPLRRPSRRPHCLRRPPRNASPAPPSPGGARALSRPGGAGEAARGGRPRTRPMTRALTIKQRRFVKAYVENGNA